MCDRMDEQINQSKPNPTNNIKISGEYLKVSIIDFNAFPIVSLPFRELHRCSC